MIEELRNDIDWVRMFSELMEIEHFASFAKTLCEPVYDFTKNGVDQISITGISTKFDFYAGTGEITKAHSKNLTKHNEIIRGTYIEELLDSFPNAHRWRLARIEDAVQPMVEDISDLSETDKHTRIVIAIRSFAPRMYLDGELLGPCNKGVAYGIDCSSNKNLTIMDKTYDNNLYLIGEHIE